MAKLLHQTSTPAALEPMPNHPRLMRVGHRFHLRVKVPKDVREAVGKTEVWKSLGTSDPKVALERVRVESVRVDQQFAEARRKLREGPGPLGETEATRMVLLWFHREEGRAVEAGPPLSGGAGLDDA